MLLLTLFIVGLFLDCQSPRSLFQSQFHLIRYQRTVCLKKMLHQNIWLVVLTLLNIFKQKSKRVSTLFNDFQKLNEKMADTFSFFLLDWRHQNLISFTDFLNSFKQKNIKSEHFISFFPKKMSKKIADTFSFFLSDWLSSLSFHPLSDNCLSEPD